jgi:hypothetical protein
MAKSQVILPRADAECGKVFYQDRRTADWDRIALEFWNQATGRTRTDSRLAVYRCKRCGGFHVSQKRVADRRESARSTAHPHPFEGSGAEANKTELTPTPNPVLGR